MKLQTKSASTFSKDLKVEKKKKEKENCPPEVSRKEISSLYTEKLRPQMTDSIRQWQSIGPCFLLSEMRLLDLKTGLTNESLRNH